MSKQVRFKREFMNGNGVKSGDNIFFFESETVFLYLCLDIVT